MHKVVFSSQHSSEGTSSYVIGLIKWRHREIRHCLKLHGYKVRESRFKLEDTIKRFGAIHLTVIGFATM